MAAVSVVTPHSPGNSNPHADGWSHLKVLVKEEHDINEEEKDKVVRLQARKGSLYRRQQDSEEELAQSPSWSVETVKCASAVKVATDRYTAAGAEVFTPKPLSRLRSLKNSPFSDSSDDTSQFLETPKYASNGDGKSNELEEPKGSKRPRSKITGTKDGDAADDVKLEKEAKPIKDVQGTGEFENTKSDDVINIAPLSAVARPATSASATSAPAPKASSSLRSSRSGPKEHLALRVIFGGVSSATYRDEKFKRELCRRVKAQVSKCLDPSNQTAVTSLTRLGNQTVFELEVALPATLDDKKLQEAKEFLSMSPQKIFSSDDIYFSKLGQISTSNVRIVAGGTSLPRWQRPGLVAAGVAVFLLLRRQNRAEIVEHRIVEGENLYRLSKRYNCPVDEIAQMNDIPNVNKIYAGKSIRCRHQRCKSIAGDWLEKLEHHWNTKRMKPSPSSATANAPPPTPPPPKANHLQAMLLQPFANLRLRQKKLPDASS